MAFLNSKGFGGNNATAVVLSADVVIQMLEKRHGTVVISEWQERQQAVAAKARAYDKAAIGGDFQVIYNFGQGMIDEAELGVSDKGIQVPGFEQFLSYESDNRFGDMV